MILIKLIILILIIRLLIIATIRTVHLQFRDASANSLSTGRFIGNFPVDGESTKIAWIGPCVAKWTTPGSPKCSGSAPVQRNGPPQGGNIALDPQFQQQPQTCINATRLRIEQQRSETDRKEPCPKPLVLHNMT
jgi:hypothetical protein